MHSQRKIHKNANKTVRHQQEQRYGMGLTSTSASRAPGLTICQGVGSIQQLQAIHRDLLKLMGFTFQLMHLAESNGRVCGVVLIQEAASRGSRRVRGCLKGYNDDPWFRFVSLIWSVLTTRSGDSTGSTEERMSSLFTIDHRFGGYVWTTCPLTSLSGTSLSLSSFFASSFAHVGIAHQQSA